MPLFSFLFLLFIYSSRSLLDIKEVQKIAYNISNDGSMDNDGSYYHPFSFSWDKISRKLNSLEPGTYVTLVWKEGDYYTTRYGHITLKPEEGKRVRNIGGVKVPENFWTKVNNEKFQNRLWRLDYHNDDFTPSVIYINDRRATLARSPKFESMSRIRSFKSFDDPDDSS